MRKQQLDKKNELRKLCLLLLAFLFWQHIGAQTMASHDSVRIFFRQGIDTLDLKYRSNQQTLDLFARRLLELSARRGQYHNVRILSSASPEGPSSLNETLARNRAEVLVEYIRHNALLKDVEFDVIPVELDWSLFRELVANSDLQEKEQVLYIITQEPQSVRKKLLKDLKGGNVWDRMLHTLYPDMRTCVLYINYADSVNVESPEFIKPDISPSAYALELPSQNSRTEKESHFIMGLKTNLLYDALAVPNLGVEFYLGKGWTVGANWMYAWWKSDKVHHYWRVYGGDFAVRKYFGKVASGRPLSGHHLGLYGQLLTYDFELGGRGYMGGRPGGTLWDKSNYGAGLEYGYSLPIGKRLNLDFSLGLGYLGGTYYEYLPIDKYYVWQATKQRCWLGPTKVEVSLVWLLGSNLNHWKKGE
ncbi:DUF3575 domain-containing protein [Phocaeicola sp.]|uniref:DUF3575 domain-containing protein n=1 Tax=Phocaeicola sp. TaxID=2773926 RepID=UPI003A936836